MATPKGRGNSEDRSRICKDTGGGGRLAIQNHGFHRSVEKKKGGWREKGPIRPPPTQLTSTFHRFWLKDPPMAELKQPTNAFAPTPTFTGVEKKGIRKCTLCVYSFPRSRRMRRDKIQLFAPIESLVFEKGKKEEESWRGGGVWERYQKERACLH